MDMTEECPQNVISYPDPQCFAHWTCALKRACGNRSREQQLYPWASRRHFHPASRVIKQLAGATQIDPTASNHIEDIQLGYAKWKHLLNTYKNALTHCNLDLSNLISGGGVPDQALGSGRGLQNRNRASSNRYTICIYIYIQREREIDRQIDR